jgi:ubiquinone/menaquinone biosynthesis C-methylase UbiE
MTDQPHEPAGYALGYSEREKQRLVFQSRFFAELTERLFLRAGIETGMSVLDVGCGVGDVSLLAAGMVGPTGSVLGIDRVSDSIERARERTRSAGLGNVGFQVATLPDVDPGRTFDALVGRLVLMYLPDPAAVIAHLVKFVRPGGVVVFQEMEMSMARSRPPGRLFQSYLNLVLETFRRAGFEIDMGSRLYSTFVRAGLPGPEMCLEARVQGGSGSGACQLLVETVRSLLPVMERLGVTTALDDDIDTLATRIEAEIRAAGGVAIPPPMIGAWTRKPA